MPREVLSLPIASIAIPAKRIGYFDPQHAVGLGADMTGNGQHDPIHVKRNGNAAKLPWTLVAGLHRLRGAEGIGWTEIAAIQVAEPSASDAELRRLELSENLDHRQRRPIERAIFMVERARLEEAVDHPGRVAEASQDRAARARWDASDTMSLASWRERTAAAMGCGVKTLERYQRIHKAIVEELPADAWRAEHPQADELPQLLNFHPLGASFTAMDRLASLNPIARLSAAKAILARPDATSIEQVLVEAGIKMSTGRRLDPEKLGAVMMDTWMRMPLAGRRAHVEWLVENVTPGMAVEMVAGFKKRGLLP